MREIIHSFLTPEDYPQKGRVSGEYYNRTGACNQCGQCCSDIYLIHNEKTIDTLELFERLKPENPEYEHFIPVNDTDHGIQFQCSHLLPNKHCAIYENRPDFCRKYPSEKSILLGGLLAKGCGYHFELKQTFQEVLSRTSLKKRLNPGKLLSS